jgi:taurine dioxygenase
MIHVQPITPSLGARITGIDLSNSLDLNDFKVIEHALHHHCYIVFPDQSLTATKLVQFAKWWGRPEPHVIDTFHHPEDPNVLILSNVVKNGKPVGLMDAARCTILHATNVPDGPNGTTFANQALAYAELSEQMQIRINDLMVNHHYGNRDDLDPASRTVASVLNESQKNKVDWVKHPLVRPHPYTGQKALYAVSGSSFTIDGMSDQDSITLLDELKLHSTQEKYCHTQHYSNGDVIVWDNALLLHRAPLIDLSKPRELMRVTVKYQ